MGNRYPVSRGFINCPRRGRIDVEICFYCPRCEEVDLDTRHHSIQCNPDLAASPEDKVAFERLGVLELAEVLGNVRQACRERHVSKYQFYKFKNRYVERGLEGLKDSTTK